MAACEDCEQEMATAAGCTADVLVLAGERFERVRHRPRRRCGDCNVAQGRFHHNGCDMERCPACGRQHISCGCSDIDDDTTSVLVVADGVVRHPAGLRGLRLPATRWPLRDLGLEPHGRPWPV